MDIVRCASCHAKFHQPGCRKVTTLKIENGRGRSKEPPVVYKVTELLNYVFNIPVTKRLPRDSEIGVCAVCGQVLRQLYFYYDKMQRLLASGSILDNILNEFNITVPKGVQESVIADDDISDNDSSSSAEADSFEVCTSEPLSIDPLSPVSTGHQHLPQPAVSSSEYTFPKVTLITAASPTPDIKMEDHSTDHNEPFHVKLDFDQESPPVSPQGDSAQAPPLRRRIANSRKARHTREITANKKLQNPAQSTSSSSSFATMTGPTPASTIIASKFLALAKQVLPAPEEPTVEVKTVSDTTVKAIGPIRRSGRKQLLVNRPVSEEPYSEPTAVGPAKKSKTLPPVSPRTARILVIDGLMPSSNSETAEIDYDSEPEVDSSQLLNPSGTEQKISLKLTRSETEIRIRKTAVEYLKNRKSKSQTKKTRNEKDRIVHGPCPYCGKTFTNRNTNWLKEHIRFRHQHISNITCNICEKPCGSNKHRLEHQKSHLSAAERKELREIDPPTQYLCQECGKIYASEEGLKQHSKLHVNIESRQLSCSHPYCDYTCLNKYSLRKHLEQMHDPSSQPKHRCKVCHRGFRLYPDLKYHEMTSCDAVNRPFACSQANCSRRFKFKHNLVPHLMDVHSLDPEEARDQIYPGLPIPNWVSKVRSKKSSKKE